MDTKRLIIAVVLLILLVVLLVVFLNLGLKERPALPEPVLPGPDSSVEEPAETTTVTLFFPSEEDALLHDEEREVVLDATDTDRAKRIIQELIRGSREGLLSPFPPHTTLRELYVSRDGVAYVDFSREMTEKHLSGSSAEISTVYSVVNSLTFNLRSIKKVFILIDGGERQTLGGHIDLTRPLTPKRDLVGR